MAKCRTKDSVAEKMHPALIEFGECVQYMPLDIAKQGKMVPRTQDGMYLGVDLTSGEPLVETKDGVFKTRSMHRKPPEERWDAEQILQLKGTPWKPYLFSDDDKIKIRVPAPVDGTDDERRLRASIQERGAMPRTFKIEKRDVLRYGQTPHCPGCYNQMHGLALRPHTQLCRDRMAKRMNDDPDNVDRIVAAQHREMAYYEKKIAESNADKKDSTNNNIHDGNKQLCFHWRR